MNKSVIRARLRLGGDVVTANGAARMMGFRGANNPDKWGIPYELAKGNRGENLYFFRRSDVQEFIDEIMQESEENTLCQNGNT